jgi:DNA-binding IclR family transcriptional regulator
MAFTSITTRKSFGATYQWAILSVLPMDEGDILTQDGMRPTDINAALGMPKEARTTVSILLKEMAKQGLIKRHELGLRWVEYTRLLPLRKRERIARWVRS